MKKIFILDAFNYLFRSYYAIGPMTNDKGQSTSAVFGFIRSLKKLIKDFSPDYFVAVFDGPDNKQAKKKVYAEYKMNRKKAPDDLYPQFDLANNFCSLAGIATLSIENVEADDTIATVANWAEKEKHLEVFICTSDKDLFQMVKKNIYVVLTHKNNMIVDEKKVKEIFGVEPKQILDYLSITGDPSDNIPGLPGFGPKTAKDLLEKFKTLDEILKHPEKIQGKKKQETIIKEQEKALLSKELATLNLNVKIPKNKDFFLIKDTDEKNLEKFYQEMKFTKFLKELKISEQTKDGKKETKKKEKTFYKLINSESLLKDLIENLSKEKEICIDTETSSENPFKANLIGIGLSKEPLQGNYIPLNSNLEEEKIISSIKKLLENPKIKFFGHNIKYDLHVLLNYNINLKNISFDTILASYLLASHHRRHNLDLLALQYFNHIKISYKTLTTKNKKKISLKEVDIEKVKDYCCEDLDYTWKLKTLFSEELKKQKLENLFYEIEIPLIFVLAKMERNGVFVDIEKLKPISNNLKREISELEDTIFKEAKIKFNINSPKQLSEVLFKKLKLPLPKRRKTEFSTSVDVLEKLSKKFKIAKDLIKYRTFQKFLSTYVNSLPKQINPKTQRIHPTFSQFSTATGRLSCQNPNLQNIPVKSLEGLNIRKAFVPQKKGWRFISSDYSQIELRILAHFSEDKELIKAFQKNQDVHTYTASLVFKVPISEVTKKMRDTAKAVNFATLYGQGAFGLSQQLNIPYKEAQNFIKTYFEQYKEVPKYIEKCIKEVENTKVAKTLLGRKRSIFEIDNKNHLVRAQAQRLAINTPLQGTAADIIKMAMIELEKEVLKKKVKGFMILQIHDELIFEIPDEEISFFKKLLKEKMENVIKLKVPLIVDIKVGKNWQEC